MRPALNEKGKRFDLGAKANPLRKPWRYIRARVIKYKAGRISIDEVADAYGTAEEMIGDVK